MNKNDNEIINTLKIKANEYLALHHAALTKGQVSAANGFLFEYHKILKEIDHLEKFQNIDINKK